MKKTTALLLLVILLTVCLTGGLAGCAKKIVKMNDAPADASDAASKDASNAETTDNEDAQPREEIPPPDYDELPPWLRETLNDYFYPDDPENRLDEITAVEFFNPMIFYTVDEETDTESRLSFVPGVSFNGSRVSIVPYPGCVMKLDRFTAYTDCIDFDWHRNKLSSFFTRKDLSDPSLTEEGKDIMVEEFSECLQLGAVVTLDPDMKNREMREIKNIFKTYCADAFVPLSQPDPDSPVDFSVLRIFPNLVSVTVYGHYAANYLLSDYAREAVEENGGELTPEEKDALALKIEQELGQKYELSLEEQASVFGDLYDYYTVPDNIIFYFRPGANRASDAPDPVKLDPASIPSKADTDALWMSRATELLP